MFETESIEFKSRFTEEIYKEIIAFANTDGGILYIGIDNDGNAIGLSDVDQEYTRITNGIRDAIHPDVTMFVKFTIQENQVVRIEVNEGSNKPYYLKSKGLKPNGVFVRQGSSSVPASSDKIRQMIKESDGDKFEDMRAIEQALTFETARNMFARYDVDFSEEKYVALGMIRRQDGLFTNLASLLSDQCEHTIKVAVFGDDANTVFKDSREFGGSLFRQLDDTFHYLSLCNKIAATFKGLERIEKPDYPEEALREALLNALVHRDYGFSGSIIINVNESEISFISLGGLLPGLSPEDIRSGISQPRNQKLAEVFHRLHLIESYGTGIRRIYHLYAQSPMQPRIEITPNTFKMILPNMNRTSMAADANLIPVNLTPQQEQIVEYVITHGYITESDIQELLHIKETRSYTIAKEMRQNGILATVGKGKDKKYILLAKGRTHEND